MHTSADRRSSLPPRNHELSPDRTPAAVTREHLPSLRCSGELRWSSSTKRSYTDEQQGRPCRVQAFSSCRTATAHLWPRTPNCQWRKMSTEIPKPPRPSTTSRPSYQSSRRQMYAARNRSLLMYTAAVVCPSSLSSECSLRTLTNVSQIVVGVGVTYAAVPLYRMFCAATGFAGTPKTGMGIFEAERLVPVEDARRIKVHFNATTSDALPWKFTPCQQFVSVLPGETSLAFYKAKNLSNKDIIGIATYNVTPDRVCIVLT